MTEKLDIQGIEAYVNCSWLQEQHEEAPDRILDLALADVAASGLTAAGKSCFAKSVKFLSKIQKMAKDAYSRFGMTFNIEIKPTFDAKENLALSPFSDWDRYTIYVGGKVYKGNLSKKETGDIVMDLITGASICGKIKIHTSAGDICAELLDSSEAHAASLYFVPEGHTCEIDLAFAECKESAELRAEGDHEGDVNLYIYGNLLTDQWTDRVDFKRADVLSVLEADIG